MGKNSFLKLGSKEMFNSDSKMILGVDFFSKLLEVNDKRIRQKKLRSF